MELTERPRLYIIEDFSPGDRIYCFKDGYEVSMGRVEYALKDSLSVRLDNGIRKQVPLSDFQAQTNLEWGKALDLDTLKVGDCISHGGPGKERIHATILEIGPSMEITMEMEVPINSIIETHTVTYTDERQGLDWWLCKWELEG